MSTRAGGGGGLVLGKGTIAPNSFLSHSCLIAMALKNSKSGSLPVSEIYSFMKEHFPYFKVSRARHAQGSFQLCCFDLLLSPPPPGPFKITFAEGLLCPSAHGECPKYFYSTKPRNMVEKREGHEEFSINQFLSPLCSQRALDAGKGLI